MRPFVGSSLLAALLAAAPLAAATVIRVGPGGDFTTFEGGVNAAVIAAHTHPETEQEVRIAAGSFAGAPMHVTAGTVRVSGGWSADFSTPDAGVTTISGPGDGVNPTLLVGADGAAAANLELRQLRVLGGNGPSLYATSSNAGSSLTIEDCRFEDSTPPAGTTALQLICTDCQRLRFADNLVRNHHLTGSTGIVNKTLSATAFGGHLELVGNELTGNRIDPGSSTYLVGQLGLFANNGASVEVTGNVVRANAIAATIARPAGASVTSDGAGSTLLFERNLIAGNTSTDAQADQLGLSANNGATITARSNLIFDAPRGLYLYALGASSTIHGSNWTIDTSQNGVYTLYNPGVMSLDSSIIWAPTALSGDSAHITTMDSTLGSDGADPFADRAAHDYHLPVGSPARDAGTNTPAGGLGTLDLDGHVRLQGRNVDRGAFEATPCVADDTTLCLGGRFAVDVEWQQPNGQSGSGHAVALTADTGYFWFFSAANVELVVKVLNACTLNQRYWVFAGGLTNVATTITVTDRFTGAVGNYENPQGTAFRPLQDTDALATCP